MTALRYSGYSCSFGYGSGQTLALTQLESLDLSPAQQLSEMIVSGTLDRGAVVLRSAAPAVRLATPDLATILGVVSATTGLACNAPCTFQWQKRADSSTFAGSGNHLKAVAQTGFLWLDSLAASGDQPAALDAMFYPLWDGSNDPYVFTDSISLANSAAYVSEFYLGPFYLNGTQILGLTGVRVSFGVRLSLFTGDGDIYPRSCSIFSRQPVISLQTTKLNFVTAQVSSVFNNSLSVTAACYFRKGASGSARVADGSSAHCKISTATGAITPRGIRFRGEDDAVQSIDLVPTGTLAMSIASTVP